MPIAPHVFGWQRRMKNTPGPLQGSSQLLGVPILTDSLGPGARVVVEIAWGAVLTNPAGTWTWYDVTADVRQANGQTISITLGRTNESSTAQPADCSFQLDNPDGRYSTNNPASTNWPNVRRNTPIRVRITLDGGTTWWIRFQGNANGFTPSWDASASLAIVSVSASGITRRLNQGKTPLRSALYRAVTRDSPLAYWPGEDGPSASQMSSAVTGGSPMVLVGNASPASFSSVNAASGSAPLPSYAISTNGASYIGTVPTTTINDWAAEFVVNVGTAIPGAASFQLVRFITSNGTWWIISMNLLSSAWQLDYFDSNTGTSITLSTPTWVSSINPFDGQGHMVRVISQQAGPDVHWWLVIDNTIIDSGTVSSISSRRILYAITNFGHFATGVVPDVFSIGHISIFTNVATRDHTNAMNGNVGETPAARMSRLCSEESVPFETVGYYNTDTTMGPQGVDTFMNLMRECEITDAGFLYDGLSAGLTYQGISQRYDQAAAMTLDASTGDIAAPFTPVDDDQRNRNLVKASRKNGSSETFEDVDGPLGTGSDGSGGIGTYDSEVTVNSVDDSRLAYRASWEVHAGTIEGLRYPVLNLDLAARPTAAQSWLNRSDGYTGPVPPGAHIDVTNLSTVATQHPAGTVPLMLEGYTETLSPTVWIVSGNCVPNQIYDVFKIGDPDLGRIQTAGSNIATDAPAGASTVSVSHTDQIGWTTQAGDFPMSVYMDGIKVTVTNITGSGNPQTFTVDPATVTKPLLSGSSVRNWRRAPIKF